MDLQVDPTTGNFCGTRAAASLKHDFSASLLGDRA
jgi:hypothetical protein